MREKTTLANFEGVKVYETLPDGWVFDEGATRNPNGYRWANNGQPRFKNVEGKYTRNESRKDALIKVEER